MKHKVCMFFLIFLLCTPGGIFCDSGSTTYEGDYYIYSIADIEALSGYTRIDGNCSIGTHQKATTLTSLEGLEGLTIIDGNLSIVRNPSLLTIDGLMNLSVINGDEIRIQRNDLLKDINALKNISTRKSIYISDNPALTNIDGLSNITGVSLDLSIFNNNLLQSIDGLSGIKSVGTWFPMAQGTLYISGNPLLINLNGLGNITTVNGALSINRNESLENLDALYNITEVGGLSITENPMLRNCDGLAGINSIEGFLRITGNPVLENINGLDSLTSLGGSLQISCNDLLPFQELENLRTGLISRGWEGCWDFTCNGDVDLICQETE